MSDPSDVPRRPTPKLSDAVRDRLLRAAYQVGWRVAHRIPQPLVRRGIALISARAVRHRGAHVTTLRHNLTVAAGRECDDQHERPQDESESGFHAPITSRRHGDDVQDSWIFG